MKGNLPFRVGIGHDTHRLGEGDHLRLGGVSLPHERQLIGHSDADVLLHAVIDALLGAAGLGDIGELFPDTEATNRDRDSAEMLVFALHQLREAGFSVVNIDTIVFAQRPRLSPYKLEIKCRLADLLGIAPEAVGIKAKTGEGVGPIGEELAIAAQCVALLQKNS